jgi:hypothetical protein
MSRMLKYQLTATELQQCLPARRSSRAIFEMPAAYPASTEQAVICPITKDSISVNG